MNVLLRFSRNETITRPAAFGTPASFGTLEWFDVFDRETGEVTPYTVSRMDGGRCAVHHPTEGVYDGLYSLNTAAELINGQRLPEVRARHAV